MAPAERLLVIVVCIIFFLGALSWLGSHGEGASQSLAFVAISIGGALLYLTPSLVGKDKKNAQAILVLNMFLGWTFIGWVVALVWAYTKDD